MIGDPHDRKRADRLTARARVELLHALRDTGSLGSDETFRYWDGKALSEVKSIKTEIDRASEPLDLQEVYSASWTTQRTGRTVTR